MKTCSVEGLICDLIATATLEREHSHHEGFLVSTLIDVIIP